MRPMTHERLRRNRTRINQELDTPDARRWLSPGLYAGISAALPALTTHIRGRCIDVGCGDMPYRTTLTPQVKAYDSIDIEQRSPETMYIGDAQHMDMLADETYDSALCLEVLEHLPDPAAALAEIHRILAPGGVLVCSAPHLSRLHEEPHDYYRYTRHGLRYLFEAQGFRVLSIEASGGLFCFLGHQLSSMLLLPIWHVPVLKQLVFALNRWLVVRPCYALDRVLDKGRIFALGYVCVVEKP